MYVATFECPSRWNSINLASLFIYDSRTIEKDCGVVRALSRRGLCGFFQETRVSAVGQDQLRDEP
jgi:hypothetical protein